MLASCCSTLVLESILMFHLLRSSGWPRLPLFPALLLREMRMWFARIY